jgi:hypothetical protein
MATFAAIFIKILHKNLKYGLTVWYCRFAERR